ncbi:MAG: VPLPA-CTERM sorting domain-containing protein [Gemmobacter sp.]
MAQKYKFKALAAASALALMTTGAANAALVDAPVPTNAFITFGGLDWAWANPLPAASGLDLSFQSAFGWRLPTAAELLTAPLAVAFMFSGANVPLGGADPVSGATFQATNADLTGAAACAAPYFSVTFRHCDWQDGLGQPFGPWAGMDGAFGFADQLVVRDAVAAIPVPAAGWLMLAGLGGLAAVRRRRKAG